MYLSTTMGYNVNFIRRISTPCTDVVEYELNGSYHMTAVRDSNLGSFFTVRDSKKYYGRCYL